MNQMFWWTVLITFISGVCGTGMGGVVSALFRKDSKKAVSLLLSFAAGVMLAVVCFDLIVVADLCCLSSAEQHDLLMPSSFVMVVA